MPPTARALGQAGEPLIPDGARVLTHCSAGWLAFVDHGSATAPIYAAQARGKSLHISATRPAPLTGAILTRGSWHNRASRTTSSPIMLPGT